MKARVVITLAAFVAVAAAGWATDVASAGAGGAPGDGGQMWLYWDNGTASGGFTTFAGNDFDISTTPSYNYIDSLRCYIYPNWPNSTLEGGRIAIYAFSGGSPGSILWGPRFRANTAFGWLTYDVGYSLGSQRTFMATYDPFYNYPNFDVLSLDTDTSGGSHSWYYNNGWKHPNRNLMLRVSVSSGAAVTPTSVGRIKALYY